MIVMPNAVSSSFRPVSRETSQRWVKAHRDYAFPFILTVGDLQPRKNHLRLIQAFEDPSNLPQTTPPPGHGGQGNVVFRYGSGGGAKSPAGHRIHFTGFVEDDELLRLYGACDLFVYPSFTKDSVCRF